MLALKVTRRLVAGELRAKDALVVKEEKGARRAPPNGPTEDVTLELHMAAKAADLRRISTPAAVKREPVL